MTRVLLTFALALVVAAQAPATDWPTILGPTRDNVSTEMGIVAPWPKAGLKKIWECDLGIGYAPPTIANGKLYHFDRFEDKARATCRDAATGKELWRFEYPMEHEELYGYDPGPRACPLIEVTDVGSAEPVGVAPGADLRTDIPRYRIYKDGTLADEVTDVTPYWRDDLVAFLLGCSFTFEWALLEAGIRLWHVEHGRNVAMWRTSIATRPAD